MSQSSMRGGSGHAKPPARRGSLRPRPGVALLGLATLVAGASLSLALPTANAIYCDRLAPLGVLAALAATLIALCFRTLSTAHLRRLPAAALLLAALSLFVSARFLARYHGVCGQVQRQLRRAAPVR